MKTREIISEWKSSVYPITNGWGADPTQEPPLDQNEERFVIPVWVTPEEQGELHLDIAYVEGSDIVHCEIRGGMMSVVKRVEDDILDYLREHFNNKMIELE